MKRQPFGFTLVEILVVVAIIGILSGLLYANFNQGSAISRDADRRADLRNLQTAIELYKNKYGRYPEGCNGPTTSVNPVWSGQSGTAYACTSGNQYIIGLAPEFVRTLPTDPRLNGNNSGYVYTTNPAGTVYKIMALNTVESLDVPKTDEFARCGLTDPSSGNSWDDVNMCARSPNNDVGTQSANSTFNECNTPSLYNRTFSLSGGFSGNVNRTSEREKEYLTEIIRCK